ncbi:phospholipase A [Fontimonas sp. SYSU GA230001]|uniref:phospholipase A n=1 Tax=Fontimonas sp. SYSU GA230001 TaxID=3142450 RepID=UPI0032B33715
MRHWNLPVLLLPAVVAAQEPPDQVVGPETPPAAAEAAPPAPARVRGVFDNLRLDADRFTLVSQTRGLSFHKPMYAMPLTWSREYDAETTEVLFQISLKQRLFNRNLFFGYTQRSFWQLYNGNDSRPFRETNYNPELFYRWKPNWAELPGLGFDIGADHESNGKTLPDSRSWNRIIGAAYYETAGLLTHLRVWYRIPEDEGRSPADPKRDDNPDITDYYGHGELRVQMKLAGAAKHQLSLMLRGNASTGKGAIEAVYSMPASDYAYWNFYVWNGYGESLADYNRSITRIGVGYMLSR